MENEIKESLQHLEAFFLKAMEFRQNGQVEKAEKTLLALLREEPRLSEPHLELAHIYLAADKLEDALSHIASAIEGLENGGQWLDIDENELLSMAYTIRGEIYRTMADQDDMIFGDQAKWNELIQLAKTSFQYAAQLDPEKIDKHAKEWGYEHHWLSSVESSIKKEIHSFLESPEIEPQPSDRHPYKDSPQR